MRARNSVTRHIFKLGIYGFEDLPRWRASAQSAERGRCFDMLVDDRLNDPMEHLWQRKHCTCGRRRGGRCLNSEADGTLIDSVSRIDIMRTGNRDGQCLANKHDQRK